MNIIPRSDPGLMLKSIFALNIEQMFVMCYELMSQTGTLDQDCTTAPGGEATMNDNDDVRTEQSEHM